ncbi:hypothetical protein [Mesorhizobium huakuii]|uniref:Uncharacterized protein n=1 Tax=Mesorhizobium huakuii TaxID=28104 RepID=A0ABZ0VMM9_9HYPH|nr:hypothetical protein [Mesorhizobium huakuii]WQB98173.1 hypothetical protein U0R22_002317 [Mesorhizobium huakuii]
MSEVVYAGWVGLAAPPWRQAAGFQHRHVRYFQPPIWRHIEFSSRLAAAFECQ